ncbi:MAG TPA: ABC transporter ATP-binding protein [Beutenbergiaceae bacterium]|nr:ABC transporter ATP-binding protein [Beutenbergiaceae bacterium]
MSGKPEPRHRPTSTVPSTTPSAPERGSKARAATGSSRTRATTDSSVLATLARLLPFLKPALPRLIAGMLCALGASLAALMVPQVLEWAVNEPLLGSVESGETSGVWIAVAMVAGLGVLEAVLIALRRWFILVPGTRVEADLRMSLFTHLQDLPVGFHDQWAGGQLLSRSMTDLGTLRRFLSFGVVMLVVNATTIAVGTYLMINLGGVLGVVFLLGALPVIYLSFRFSRQFRHIARLSQDQAGDLATTVEESVHGIRVLKAFGRAREAYHSFSAEADELRRTEIRKARAMSAFSFAITTIPEVVLGITVLIGIWLVTNGNVSVGALVAFFATAAIMAGPVEQVGELMAMSLTAKTAVDRYFEVLDTPNSVTDPAKPKKISNPRGQVRFDGVRFHFPDAPLVQPVPQGRPDQPVESAREEVLAGIDLQIRAGETMALVGLTGSGKTTMVSLVPRLYDVTGGAVRIDGVDVRDMTRHHLRTLVSIAFEDSTLFSASVRENVLMGAPQGQDTDADLDRALTVAQAQFAYHLPEGVDTVIGEEGLSLSGGQRQRLALARAVAARPTVLVLDDPLSALDVSTEEAVTSHLRVELQETTTLIVAHRPSTVALADRVAVLQEGKIVGVGTHSELLADNEHYRFVISSLVADEQYQREQEEYDQQQLSFDRAPRPAAEDDGFDADGDYQPIDRAAPVRDSRDQEVRR